MLAAIAYDACSGYNVNARSALPLGYQKHIIPNASLLHLAGASKEPLHLSGLVNLVFRLVNTFFRRPFVIADRLAVTLVLGTAFADEHVRVHYVQSRKLELFKGESVQVAPTLPNGLPADYRPPSNQSKRSRSSSLPPYAYTRAPVRLNKSVLVPALPQKTVRVRSPSIALSYLDPRPFVATCHGIHMTIVVAKLDPRKKGQVLVTSFS